MPKVVNHRMKPPQKIILNQPSWRIATAGVEAWLTHAGGHLGPVTFSLAGGRKVRPFSVAPWHSDALPRGTPPVLKVLRGDFFCMPFGGNASALGKERHPVHGETANARWQLRSFEKTPQRTTLRCTLETRVRQGRVDKRIELRRGESVVYQRHTVSGMSGPMCFGHHAMLKFPDGDGSGVVSTSPFRLGKVYPEPIERPENRGYSILRPGAEFKSLRRVPTITGEVTDVSRYPARRGFEDLLILAADDSRSIAWNSVVFPGERYAWIALRDPRQLASTILWISNGGRHFPPWNGRHVNVVGIEDVTAYFHPGLKESVQANDLNRRGIQTSIRLNRREPTTVNHIMAVVAVPKGFARVAEIAPGDGSVTLRSNSGMNVKVPMDLGWLKESD